MKKYSKFVLLEILTRFFLKIGLPSNKKTWYTDCQSKQTTWADNDTPTGHKVADYVRLPKNGVHLNRNEMNSLYFMSQECEIVALG